MKRSNEEVSERRDQLLQRIKELKTTNIRQLSTDFGVSEMTIRRDCLILVEMGQISQSFGKLEIIDKQERSQENADSLMPIKSALAKEAATFIKNKDTLFINTSSTALQILEFLKDKRINVLTNNTKVIYMDHNPQSTIILSGGEVRSPKEALSGDLAMESFSNVRSDVAVIGVSGVDFETGLSTSVVYEAKINTKMIENSNKIIVVADYRKIGKTSNFTIAPLSSIDLLITDTYADRKVLDQIEKIGVQIIQVPC